MPVPIRDLCPSSSPASRTLTVSVVARAARRLERVTIELRGAGGSARLPAAAPLLHETAHHLLHDLQEVRRFLRSGPATAEVQAFASPWRGTRRPGRRTRGVPARRRAA